MRKRYLTICVLTCIILLAVETASSVEEESAKADLGLEEFVSVSPASGEGASPSGVFVGQRRQLPAPGRSKVMRWDSESGTVTPILTTGTVVTFLNEKDLWGVSVSAGGDFAVASCIVASDSEKGHVANLYRLDFTDDRVTTALADAQWNVHPSLSPNGRWVAFWSSDPFLNFMPEPPLVQNRGRVLNIETSEVLDACPGWTFPHNYYELRGAPPWLDEERVLFHSMTTDAEMLQTHLPKFSGDASPYVAVFNVGTEKTAYFFIPKVRRSVSLKIHRPTKRLYFYNATELWTTDFDLENRRTVLEVGEGKAIYSVRPVGDGCELGVRDTSKRP